MRTIVLDAHALMVFLEDEPGADLVRETLMQAEQKTLKLLMCVVNLGEVWYSIARVTSPQVAEETIQQIQGMEIEFVEAGWEITRQAAVFKARGGISYADCFAAATASLNQAELLTGDPEFRALEAEIKIGWL
jgi:predicted nucleic acid-binding protein